MSASTSQNQRIAVIGLGSMGYGMATSLKRAGADLIVTYWAKELAEWTAQR